MLDHRLFSAVASDETSMRHEAAKAFPTDLWSRDDDFHRHEGQKTRDWAGAHHMRLSDAFRALDDGLRSHWPQANRGPLTLSTPPCRPRAILRGSSARRAWASPPAMAAGHLRRARPLGGLPPARHGPRAQRVPRCPRARALRDGRARRHPALASGAPVGPLLLRRHVPAGHAPGAVRVAHVPAHAPVRRGAGRGPGGLRHDHRGARGDVPLRPLARGWQRGVAARVSGLRPQRHLRPVAQPGVDQLLQLRALAVDRARRAARPAARGVRRRARRDGDGVVRGDGRDLRRPHRGAVGRVRGGRARRAADAPSRVVSPGSRDRVRRGRGSACRRPRRRAPLAHRRHPGRRAAHHRRHAQQPLDHGREDALRRPGERHRERFVLHRPARGAGLAPRPAAAPLDPAGDRPRAQRVAGHGLCRASVALRRPARAAALHDAALPRALPHPAGAVRGRARRARALDARGARAHREASRHAAAGEAPPGPARAVCAGPGGRRRPARADARVPRREPSPQPAPGRGRIAPVPPVARQPLGPRLLRADAARLPVVLGGLPRSAVGPATRRPAQRGDADGFRPRERSPRPRGRPTRSTSTSTFRVPPPSSSTRTGARAGD